MANGDRTSDARLDRDMGQLFMVGFDGLTPTQSILDLVERDGVGGVILFSRNCHSARQVSRLTRDLQAVARAAGHRAPLLIAVDQENGLVQRLGPAITTLPGAMALGAARSDKLTFDVARATGNELLALGVNMNLAPVADINSNPRNPVIGARSFGQEPALVARMTAAAVRGFHAAGVAATLKHFPGHGDTVLDSHLAAPSMPHTRERLEDVELVPFRAGMAAGAGALMLAHLRLPGLATGEDLPGSLSPVAPRLAREGLGFHGIIMTDCLEMAAVANTVGVAQGALLALRAGVDIALISHTLSAQREAISRARAGLAHGELDADTVRQAVERTRAFKYRFLSWDNLPRTVWRLSVSATSHQRLRDRAYRRAVTLVRDTGGHIPIILPESARVLVVACPPERVSQAGDRGYQHDALAAAVRQWRANTVGALIGRGPGEMSVSNTLAQATEADLIIVTLLHAGRDAPQRHLVQRLIAIQRPLIAIAASDPYDAAAFPDLDSVLVTYEYTPAALGAAIGAIFGDFTPGGKLPIQLSSKA